MIRVVATTMMVEEATTNFYQKQEKIYNNIKIFKNLLYKIYNNNNKTINKINNKIILNPYQFGPMHYQNKIKQKI